MSQIMMDIDVRHPKRLLNSISLTDSLNDGIIDIALNKVIYLFLFMA